MSDDAVVLHAADDVATLLRALPAGSKASTRTPTGTIVLTLCADIPRCHKVAVRALAAGAPVRKYGAVIGALTAAVDPGDHVHVHNLSSLRGRDWHDG